MAVLDFRLQHLLKDPARQERIHVLLEFHNEFSQIEGLNFQVTSRVGKIAAGSIPANRLQDLANDPKVKVVERSRPLKDELDRSSIAINLVDPVLNRRVLDTLGEGAIIGIIDSGFDLTHPCFLNPENKTRILGAWDQVNVVKADGKPPGTFGYGIEYTTETINQHLGGEALVVTNLSGGKHGTNVAGIAAGNGAPDGVFKGIAPASELIFVVYKNEPPIGGSAFVLDAITFIEDLARKRGKPLVVNISQGDNLGAHDGTSLLEKAIDFLVERNRAVFVTSAGNQRGQRHHAEGTVPANREYALLFRLKPDENEPIDGDEVDIWYRQEDRFAVALETPAGWRSEFIQPNTSRVIRTPSGARASVYSETMCPSNEDNRISVVLEKGNWELGAWKLILKGIKVSNGFFHAWTDRENINTAITFCRASDNCTTTLPGTSRGIITVSGFVSRALPFEEGDVYGALAPFTSIGRTRDNRIKPDLTAPGFGINAPGIHKESDGGYEYRMGTSMAAPHVSGVAALLLSLKPDLTAEQVKSILVSTASFDLFTGITPNDDWGRGKLDARAAYEALSTLEFVSHKIGERK